MISATTSDYARNAKVKADQSRQHLVGRPLHNVSRSSQKAQSVEWQDAARASAGVSLNRVTMVAGTAGTDSISYAVLRGLERSGGCSRSRRS